MTFALVALAGLTLILATGPPLLRLLWRRFTVSGTIATRINRLSLALEETIPFLSTSVADQALIQSLRTAARR